MELLNQPFNGQLGDRLIELLASDDYNTLNIAVAFAKNSGVLRIKKSLESFREKGGKINVYVGVDLGGTSYEALTALLCNCDSLNIIHLENSQTFHVKIYQFMGKNNGLLNIGSHNLTGGGLWTNLESSVFIPIDKSNAKQAAILTTIESYLDELKSLKASFMTINTQQDIEKLLENGYIVKEVSEKLWRAKRVGKGTGKESLFGKTVLAKLPSIAKAKKQKTSTAAPATLAQAPAPTPTKLPSSIASLQTEEGDTIWIETRKLTGGSRNILDLSKKSLVVAGNPSGTPFDLGEKKFMRGAVEFFGVDTQDTDQTKDVTINFEGVDYTKNSIIYPTGNNPNGTWRLQIKGVSPSNRKITEALAAKGEGHYLVEKVVAFTKIQEDYFFMSVLPETELTDFKKASSILARNGSSKQAKLLGVL